MACARDAAPGPRDAAAAAHDGGDGRGVVRVLERRQLTSGRPSGRAPGEAADQPDSGPDAGTATSTQGRRDARTHAKLRETERQRDRPVTALGPHTKGAVEKAVGDRLQDASSLWLLPNLDPLSLVTEDYSLDDEKLTEAVERLLSAAPTLGRRFDGSVDEASEART